MIVFTGNFSSAQIKIGLPLGLADSSAVLDLSNAGGSGNKGFLLPQVNLSSTIVWGLLGTIVTDGMVVFNKATAGSGTNAVIPGLYFWAGGQWTLISQTTANTATYIYCNSSAFYPSPSSGLLYNGNAYTANYSIDYTSGSGAAYNSISQTFNGLTLTRVAGTYATGGGNIIYNLSGTYTGTTNGTVPFSIVECGNTAIYGASGTIDYVRASLNSSGAAYDAATSGSWVNVTGSEYATALTSVNSTTVLGQPETIMNTTTYSQNTAGLLYTANTNTTLPANNYLFGFSFMPGNTASVTAGFNNIAASTSLNSGTYTTFPAGIGLPAMNLTANTRYYFLFKKQSTITANTLYLAVFLGSNGVQVTGTTGLYYSTITGSFPSQTNTTNPLTAYGQAASFQWLATPTKQW